MKGKKIVSVLFLTLFLGAFLFPVFNTIFMVNAKNDLENKDIRLSDVIIDGYFVPGITGSVSIDNIIKIGHVHDIGTTVGDLSEEGAILAAREINEASGVMIDGTQFYVGIVSEDTNELSDVPDFGEAQDAVNSVLHDHDAHFVVGGGRTDMVASYRDIIMANQTVFLNTGGNEDSFTQDVINNYSFYKYYFRTLPVNDTSFGIFTISNLFNLVYALNLSYSENILDIGILREAYSWTVGLTNNLTYIFSTYGFNVHVYEINTLSPLQSIMIDDLNNTDECDVVIPLVTQNELSRNISDIYATYKPNYLLAGIDAPSALESHWDLTEGACEYEILIQNFHGTNLTSSTMPFWNSFVEEYGHEPISNAAGAYDAVYMLVSACMATESFNSDDIVDYLELFDKSTPFIGVLGQIGFDPGHSVLYGYPFLTPLMCQWQMDGMKVVLPSYLGSYPSNISTGALRLPPWVLSAWGVDPGLPGGFSLSSTAETPDPDGAFNLTWTPSSGAKNYSIYHSSEPITYIHDGLDLLVEKNGSSPYYVSGLGGGTHYFLVVAYNESGQTFSNLHSVEVSLPPGSFVLSCDAEFPADTDGAFTLNWTPSLGAESYSIYVNGSYHANTMTSPFLMANLTEGTYNISVVAQNRYGNATSNHVDVTVSLYLPPVSDEPPDIQESVGEVPWINWRLSSNYAGGEYRVIANNSAGQYYIHQDWQPWTSGVPISVRVNASVPGTYNYTIVYRDILGQYGIPNTVMVSLSSYSYSLVVSTAPNVIDPEVEIGARFEIHVNAEASIQIVEQDSIFTGASAIEDALRFVRYYSLTVFDSEFVENNSLFENATIRFYFDGDRVNPSNLVVYHYLDSMSAWEVVDHTLNEGLGYIEIIVTDLSYFSFAELSDNSAAPFPFELIVIISALIVLMVSAVSAVMILKRKKKSTSVSTVAPMAIANKDSMSKKRSPLVSNGEALHEGAKVPSEEQERTEKEIGLEEDLDKCIVHKGVIRGISYVCPTCHAKYCLKCLKVLSDSNEKCWVCDTDNFKDDEAFKQLISLPDDTNNE